MEDLDIQRQQLYSLAVLLGQIEALATLDYLDKTPEQRLAAIASLIAQHGPRGPAQELNRVADKLMRD